MKGKKIQNSTLFNRKGMLFANLCAAIPLIHFAIFYLWMNWQSVMLAFGYPLNGGEWQFTTVYFNQFFVEIVSPDSVIFRALANTLLFFFSSIVKMFLCYIISYFFFKKVYFHNVFKLIFLLPTIISSVVFITFFKKFINTYGPLYMLLNNLFGYEMPLLTANVATAKWVILFYSMWSGFGVQMMIFVGAMSRIPTEVLESARLDGCSWRREMYNIVLPMTWETFMIYFITAFTGVFMATGPILYFTGMSEALDTWTINFFIFYQTRGMLLNYSSAIGLIFSVLTVPIVLIVRLLLRRFNNGIAY